MEKETLLRQGHPAYPAALGQFLSDNALSSVAALDNLDAIKHAKLALFCEEVEITLRSLDRS